MNKKSYWVGLFVSIVFLSFFLRKIDWVVIWQILHSLELIYILPLMLVSFLTILIRSKRWQYLLSPIKWVPLWELYKATAIGFMANYLLPARAGEFVRAFLLGSRMQISKTASFATIVVERVFDGLTIMLMFLVVLFVMPFPPAHSSIFNEENIKLAGLLSFLFYLFVLGILLLMRFHSQRSNRIFGFLLKPLPTGLAVKIEKKMEAFVFGLSILKNAGNMIIPCLYSGLLWGVSVTLVYLLFIPFQIKLSFLAAIFINIILVFGITLPSAPGFIGTFHWACAAALIFLGVEENLAKSYAVILWLVCFIPITFLGLFLLYEEGISLKALKAGSKTKNL
jgi:glycosyltransferase 2 family protein